MSESAAAVSCRARNRSGAIPGRPGPGPRKVIQIDPGGSLPAGPGRQRATNLWDPPDPLETGTPSGDLMQQPSGSRRAAEALGGCRQFHGRLPGDVQSPGQGRRTGTLQAAASRNLLKGPVCSAA